MRPFPRSIDRGPIEAASASSGWCRSARFRDQIDRDLLKDVRRHLGRWRLFPPSARSRRPRHHPTSYRIPHLIFRHFQFPRCLHIHPEPGGSAEIPRQTQCGFRRDAALLIDDVVDARRVTGTRSALANWSAGMPRGDRNSSRRISPDGWKSILVYHQA